MIDNTQLNIDRLEDVISAILGGYKWKLDRGLGVTTGYLHLMLREISEGNEYNNYCFITDGDDLKRTLTDFMILLSEAQIPFIYDKTGVKVSVPYLEQVFFFTTEDNFENKSRGHTIRTVFVDTFYPIQDYTRSMIHSLGAKVL